jgi:pSer/pThr/pTyr-binding forkhead associated (FHA) protein
MSEMRSELTNTSHWGTTSFAKHNQIVLDIVGVNEPLILNPEGSLMIGRADTTVLSASSVDLTPYDASELGVSRKHAVIERADNVISIRDLESANGTYLNGQRLHPKQSCLLRDGDKLRLGNLVMHVYFR